MLNNKEIQFAVMATRTVNFHTVFLTLTRHLIYSG